MLVQYNSQLNTKSPTFKSIYYQPTSYRDTFGVKRETQNSTGKRTDLDYKKLSKIISQRFNDYDRVNIRLMNVSDGTEGYFLLANLANEVGLDEVEKKYSITATDVCKDVIETYPKRGLVHLFKGESDELVVKNNPMFVEVDKAQYDNLFETANYEKLYKIKPEFRKFCKFGVFDFQDGLSKMNDRGNTVVAIRNCLRESFGDTKSALIVYNIASKLKGKSLFLTGDYDRGMPLFESALDDNFVEIERNVWAKRDFEVPDGYGLKLSEKLKESCGFINKQAAVSNYATKLMKKIR